MFAYVVRTAKEGRLMFTISTSREEAWHRFCDACDDRLLLLYPIDNPKTIERITGINVRTNTVAPDEPRGAGSVTRGLCKTINGERRGKQTRGRQEAHEYPKARPRLTNAKIPESRFE